MKLKDAKILISGGSLGIGKATAKLLVENGADVIITGRDEERLKKAADQTGAFPIVADVANPEDIPKSIFISGFDTIFPKGFRIGKVVDCRKGEGAFYRIKVEPAVDLYHIEEVSVILMEP